MKPQLSTLRDRIRAVPKRWRKQYETSPYWTKPFSWGRPAREVAEALEALDTATCSAADIDAVMGIANGHSWCAVSCNGCEKSVHDDVVFVGDEPDYESSSATLCVSCLREALALTEHADERSFCTCHVTDYSAAPIHAAGCPRFAP